jgi:hypothetical protein
MISVGFVVHFEPRQRIESLVAYSLLQRLANTVGENKGVFLIGEMWLILTLSESAEPRDKR